MKQFDKTMIVKFLEMLKKDAEDIYRKLRRHLDQFLIGYPSTESGVEMRLLKHHFTHEEAEIATHLTILPQTLAQTYKSLEKMGIPVEKLERALAEMGEKGYHLPVQRKKRQLLLERIACNRNNTVASSDIEQR